MKERGIVRAIRGGVAEVEVTPASPEACRTCGGCQEQPQGLALLVDAVDGLRPGSRVWIEVQEGGELGPAVAVFLLPVLAILIGAILGAKLPDWTTLGSGNSTWFALLGAVVLLVPVLILIRVYDRSRSRRELGPRIVDIES